MASIDGSNLCKKMEQARRLHNKLLYTTIAINYLHSCVDNGIPEKQFRANFKNYANDPLSSSAKDVYQMIEILETKELVGIGDYDILIDIVQFDERIVREIESIKLVLYTQGISIYRRIDPNNTPEVVQVLPNRCKYTLFLMHLHTKKSKNEVTSKSLFLMVV